jgi:uncharacterized protein (DUF1810 family)
MKYPFIESLRNEYDFSDFYTESNRDYPGALQEMKRGRKTGHWIWYILPQLSSLGTSRMAKFYGLKSFHEAAAYFNDPILGPRLVEICGFILNHLKTGVHIDRLMGSSVDAVKLLTCSTLFEYVTRSTQHANLFLQLRECCELALTPNRHTISFCDVSLLCASPATWDEHIDMLYQEYELNKMDRVCIKEYSDAYGVDGAPSREIHEFILSLLPSNLSSSKQEREDS